jgi:flagellar basal-body rod modification protein FlgD
MTTTSATSTTNSNQALIDSVNKRTSATTSQSSETQDRFLKLLTTQLKNQDPLNPLDNAQVTSQLAQISTVSGIEKLNATLQMLVQDSQSSQTTQAASLVGHAVMVPGNGLQLSSGKSVGAFELAGDADAVKVTIKDSNGLEVRTLTLSDMKAGLQDFTWDGKTNGGAQAADGSYTISVAATAGSDKVGITSLTLGTVRSVISNSGGYMLDVGALGTFTLDDVKQIL